MHCLTLEYGPITTQADFVSDITDYVCRLRNDVNNLTNISIGLAMPPAFTVTNSPLIGSGTLNVIGAGTTLQYIDGTGNLQTFPTIPPPATLETADNGLTIAATLTNVQLGGDLIQDTFINLNNTYSLVVGNDLTYNYSVIHPNSSVWIYTPLVGGLPDPSGYASLCEINTGYADFNIFTAPDSILNSKYARTHWELTNGQALFGYNYPTSNDPIGHPAPPLTNDTAYYRATANRSAIRGLNIVLGQEENLSSSGDWSIAGGQYCTTIGNYSVGIGQSHSVYSDYSTAFGYNNVIDSSGEGSFVGGEGNYIQQRGATAFGWDNAIINDTYLAHVEGYSFASGIGNYIGGSTSVAIGSTNSIYSDYTSIIGLNNNIDNTGYLSNLHGYSLRNTGARHFVTGVFNDPTSVDTVDITGLNGGGELRFTIGGGTQSGSGPILYKNIFHVFQTGTVRVVGAIDQRTSPRGIMSAQMTTVQRTGYAPAEGEMVYDTDLHKLFCYDGTTWQGLW
jgi:hypothetical protein